MFNSRGRSNSLATACDESSSSESNSDNYSNPGSLPAPATDYRDAPGIERPSNRADAVLSVGHTNLKFTQIDAREATEESEYQSGDCGYKAMNITRLEAYNSNDRERIAKTR